MPGNRFSGQYPVVEFPRPLQLVQVFGANVVEIFLQHVEQFQAAVEQRFAGQ